jgi:RNA polymerase sigma-70 factor (ECF subfamily)
MSYMQAADEQQLILQAKEGDHEAFRCLVERYMKLAYNIAYGFLSNHHDAEETAQEAFIRVYESIASFRGDAEFATWLYRIVMNLSLNRLKRTRRRRELHVDPPAMDAMPEHSDPSGSLDLAGHIERALHELPLLQRAAVILRHMDGLSTKQVSKILRCSEGTVKTHVFRGLEKMRQKLHYLLEEGI